MTCWRLHVLLPILCKFAVSTCGRQKAPHPPFTFTPLKRSWLRAYAMSAASRAYYAAHGEALEVAIAEALQGVLNERPADPVARFAELLAARGDPQPSAAPPSPAKLVLPAQQNDPTDEWALAEWAKSTGTDRVVTAAIAHRAGSTDGTINNAATCEFLLGLKSRDELARVLRDEAVVEANVDVVWDAVLELQQAGAATNAEIEGKFAGAIAMEYGGLEKYFGGLEGVVGGPNQKIREGMAAEHVSGPESDKIFETGNYGVVTTSKTEWLFVTEEDEAAALSTLGLESWPAESEKKLPDRSRCRKRRPLADVERAAEAQNARLLEAKHTTLISEELIAAIMYTGPV